jgi:hypothetical protein
MEDSSQHPLQAEDREVAEEGELLKCKLVEIFICEGK